MAYIRCAGNSGGSIEKKTASGSIATFTTAIPTALADVTSVIGYRESGYTSATAINSKTAPIHDFAPYHTRINNNIGNLALEKLVGVSCVFNQLQSNTTSRTNNNVTYTFNNGELTVQTGTGGATGDSWWLTGSDIKWNWVKDHVYFITLGNPNYSFSGGNAPNWYIPTSPQTSLLKNETLVKVSATANTYLQFKVGSGNEINTSFKPQIFDLTAMFGSTVADYIYTLESGNAGAGVSLFKSLFADEYYPYTANTLISAKPTGKKIVGFNQWDEEYANGYFNASTGVFVEDSSNTSIASKNYIKAIGGATYCLKQPTSSQPQIYQYDSEKNFISRITGISIPYGTFTLNSNTAYIKFICFNYGAGIYNNDICLNISDNAKNGTYEPYSETTIVYSGNELRGLLKAGTDGLYADGDIDDGSGSTQVRYGIVDLGSLTYSYDSGIFINYKSAGIDIGAKGRGIDFVCSSYSNSGITSSANMPDKSLQIIGASGNANLWIKDSGYNDATAFKTALNGVYLVYELATPTTAVSTAWSNPIIAKEGGTEEFTDTRTVKMFTGHDTIYGTDMTVNKAEFGTTVYGGSVDFTTGEVISNKNADGSDKTAESISITPVPIMANFGANNLMSDTNGDTTVQYLDLRSS